MTRKESKKEVLRLLKYYNDAAPEAEKHRKLTGENRYRRYNAWQRIMLIVAAAAVITVALSYYLSVESIGIKDLVVVRLSDHPLVRMVTSLMVGLFVWWIIYDFFVDFVGCGKFLPLDDTKAAAILYERIDELRDIHTCLEHRRQELAPLLKRYASLCDCINREASGVRYWLNEDLDKGFYVTAFLPNSEEFKDFTISESGLDEFEQAIKVAKGCADQKTSKKEEL